MKTGDQVVCLTTYEGIFKNRNYIIRSIVTMTCGCVVIDVGVREDCDEFQVECRRHSNVYTDNTNTRWYGIERFAPIQTDEFLSSDKIEKSAEEKIDIKLPETIEL